MNDIISIIVPVYNMELYLDRCMQSLVTQEYKNIEIILVDDGSTDSSAVLCDEWGKRDVRVKVFHKENGGQCTARNLGLEAAHGAYIAFVDSDDYVDASIYNRLLDDMIQYDADISCCATTNSEIVGGSNAVSIFTNEEVMSEHLADFSVVGQSPCDKLFKRELFEEIRFPLLRAYEDCATIYKLLAKARRVVYRDSTLYHYIHRKNSTMTQSFSCVKFIQIDVYWMMYQDYICQYPQYAYLVKQKLIGACQYCVGESYKAGKHKEFADEIVNVQDKLRKLNSIGLPFTMKLTRMLMLYLPSVFAFIYQVGK